MALLFERLSVTLAIRTNSPSLRESLLNFLPELKPSVELPSDLCQTFWLTEVPSGHYEGSVYSLSSESTLLLRTTHLPDLFHLLESQIHHAIATHTQQALLVHAGVISWRGKLAMIPGRSHSGKSSLVAALVKAGATYYSDEFAVIDHSGWIHPYPKSLYLRTPEGRLRLPVRDLGGWQATQPLPLSCLILTEYEAGVPWSPREVSPGQAALALLSNTVRARYDPKTVLIRLRQTLETARAFLGQRGEAEEVVSPILTLIRPT